MNPDLTTEDTETRRRRRCEGLSDGEGSRVINIGNLKPAVDQPNLLSNSLCDPIHAHSIVSPSRSPTARYCSLMRTDQTLSCPWSFLNRSDGCSGSVANS